VGPTGQTCSHQQQTPAASLQNIPIKVATVRHEEGVTLYNVSSKDITWTSACTGKCVPSRWPPCCVCLCRNSPCFNHAPRPGHAARGPTCRQQPPLVIVAAYAECVWPPLHCLKCWWQPGLKLNSPGRQERGGADHQQGPVSRVARCQGDGLNTQHDTTGELAVT
jgi:hypothetical protein